MNPFCLGTYHSLQGYDKIWYDELEWYNDMRSGNNPEQPSKAEAEHLHLHHRHHHHGHHDHNRGAACRLQLDSCREIIYWSAQIRSLGAWHANLKLRYPRIVPVSSWNDLQQPIAIRVSNLSWWSNIATSVQSYRWNITTQKNRNG